MGGAYEPRCMLNLVRRTRSDELTWLCLILVGWLSWLSELTHQVIFVLYIYIYIYIYIYLLGI